MRLALSIGSRASGCLSQRASATSVRPAGSRPLQPAMPIVTAAGDRSRIRLTVVGQIVAVCATSGRKPGLDIAIVSVSVKARFKLPTVFEAAEHALEGFPALVEGLPDAAFHFRRFGGMLGRATWFSMRSQVRSVRYCFRHSDRRLARGISRGT
jgi:hypothetical protein